MLYLEDYLEMIEHLPQELRDRFTEIREMDLQVHNAMDNLEEESRQFFTNAKRMKPDQREAEFTKIKQEYFKTLEDAEEKVHLANQIYELVERYLRRLDQELQKFKIELEADNAGITEVLERRSLELDNPPQTVNHIREKRKFSMHGVTGTPPAAHSTGHYARESIASGNLPFATNNLNSSRMNVNSFPTSLSTVVTTPSSTASNGNPLLGSSLSNMSATAMPPNSGVNNPSSASSLTGSSPLSYNLGAGNTAIAAAASQAIAATQQMQQGRRTASLKASIDAINAGLQNICDFGSLREAGIGGSLNSSASFHGIEGSSGIRTKRNRTSSQFQDQDDSSETMAMEENGTPVDWSFDPNEPRYCLCNQVSYGDMVACDNEDCQFEWFHYGCVGITQPPKGKWFCPQCSSNQLKKKKKEKS